MAFSEREAEPGQWQLRYRELRRLRPIGLLSKSLLKLNLLSENGPSIMFDRAVVPIPYGKDEILDSISPIVKPGGAIHFYTFKKRHQIDGLIQEFEEKGLAVEFHRRCGNVAPGVSRWAFDLVKF